MAGMVVLATSGCGSDDGGSTIDRFSVASYEPDHLTPGRAAGAFDEIHALFAPLVKFGDDNELDYIQAKSVTSTDNREWTITINEGWQFHNGDPVTAQSYADAWNATAYGPNAWSNNAELSSIEGYAALNPASGKPTAKTLSGVEVVDKVTLKVTLVAPDSQFPYKLTQPAFYPLPSVAFDDPKAYDEAPVGDGPFKMDGSWKHDVSISMTRFDNYKGPQPHADALEFKIYSDASTAYTDAVAGAVDIVSVPQEKFGQLHADFGDRFTAFDAVALDWLGFPLWDKRFQDVRVREAISMAIDRDALNKAIFADLYTPATSLTPSTAIGGGTEGECGQYCSFDPGAARQLLKDAGGWNGPMEIWFPGGVGYDQTFNAIANQIRENLGIDDVTVKSQPGFTQYLSALDKHSVTGPFRGHWGSLYPSMQNLLTAVFTANGDGNTGSGGYSSDPVDRLIDAANAADTPSEATHAYKQAEAKIVQDFPVAPLFYAKYVYAHSSHVTHVTIGFDQIELTDVTVVN